MLSRLLILGVLTFAANVQAEDRKPIDPTSSIYAGCPCRDRQNPTRPNDPNPNTMQRQAQPRPLPVACGKCGNKPAPHFACGFDGQEPRDEPREGPEALACGCKPQRNRAEPAMIA